MLVEYVRYQATDDTSAVQLLKAYREAGPALRDSLHCLSYDLTQCADDPCSLILRIEWDSAEGHLHGFRKSPEFKIFFVAVQPLVGMTVEMRHYEAIDVEYSR